MQVYESGQRALLLRGVALLALLMLLAACGSNATDPTATATLPQTSVATPTGAGGEEFLPPDATTPTPAPSPVGLTENDRVDVYSHIIGTLLQGDLGTRFIYISPYIGQGEHLDSPDEETPVPSTLMESLEPAYHDRSFEVRDFADATDALEDGGRVKNDGIFVTLGPIVNDSSGSNIVTARASYYRGVGDARGDLYSLQRAPSSSTGWELLTQEEEWNYKTVP